MKKLILLILVFPSIASALDAVVTVLEAPILEEKSRYSKVVQYLRKGDVIKIHPSVANETRYDDMAPTPEKQAEVKKKLAASPEWNEDRMFTGDESLNANIEDEFIPVLDRRGRRGYVISEHIYVYFEDKREFRHMAYNNKDRTDYRLQEPLPKGYPLIRDGGYRGQITFGLTQPYDKSYPYKLNVKTKGYSSPLDLNFTLMRNSKSDTQDRYYYGLNIGLRYHQNRYLFAERNRTSQETVFKAGLGPMISYDVYKGEQNRIALYARSTIYFFNLMKIEQSEDSKSDSRRYLAVSAAPSIGAQYHRKNIVEDLDIVIGASIETEISTDYRAQNGAGYEGWWRKTGNDSFRPGTSFNLLGYIGLQSVY